MIGRLFNDRYRFDLELGRGGMGVVYRAEDTLLQRNVAVKVLGSAGAGTLDTEARARLLHEARAAAQLNHPNIISIYDAGEVDALPYIVMEYVQGESLQVHRPGSFGEMLEIARQICLALEHAHAHAIVHRDLKPANVLITPSGGVKLTDFGLARSSASRITTEGAIVGTVFYLPPEQAMGKEVDGRTDLYALGVILYEMTAGRLPFVGNDPLAVISQHLYAPVVPPSTYNADIPPILEKLIIKLLEKQPGERFASAGEVAARIAEIQAPSSSVSLPAPVEIIEADTILLLEKLARGRLVGRRSELNQLRDLWKHTLQGGSRLVLLSGEPGVGKTRLAREMLVYARLGGACVLQGGCYEVEAATPYLPFAEALREWVREQNTQTLRLALGVEDPASLAPELARLAPEIESKLGGLTPNPALTPNEERLRLFDNVTRFFQRQAAETSLLIFIDDLHWADQGTLSLLHYLLRNLRSAPVMLLGAYREVELDRTHPFTAALVEWNRERLTMRLPLGRLNRVDVGELLAALFGVESASVEFIDAIYHETEGNPFFIEEVVKALIEQGQIFRVNGRWDRQEVHHLAIPQSIKEAIGRRLDRLDSACIELLRVAAVLGKRFNFHSLALASPVDEEATLDALDQACAAQLLRAESGDNFAFTHDKIREVLHEELNPIRRRRLHRKIGESLEQLYLGGSSPAAPGRYVQDLAFHFIECGDLEKGMRYAILASEHARSLFAQEDALHYLERALECAETLGKQDQLAAIHKEIGGVHSDRGLPLPAIQHFELALSLTQAPQERASLKVAIGTKYTTLGDPRGLEYLHQALVELDPQAQRSQLAMATAMIGRYYHYQRDWQPVFEYLLRALEIAEPSGDVPTLTWIYAFLAGACQQSQHLDESLEWARRCIEIGEKMGNLAAVALGCEFTAEDLFMLGRWNEALEFARKNIGIGQQIGSLERVAWGYGSTAYALHGLGDLPAALEASDQAAQIAEQLGDIRASLFARTKRAQVLAEIGEIEMAEAEALSCWRDANELNQKQQYLWVVWMQETLYRQQEQWAELLEMANAHKDLLGDGRLFLKVNAHLMLNRLDEIPELVASFKTWDTSGWSEPERLKYQALLGSVLFAEGQTDQAFRVLDDTLAGIEKLAAHLSGGRVLAQRGDLWLAVGRLALARADFQRAWEILDRCGAKREVESIRNKLSILGKVN